MDHKNYHEAADDCNGEGNGECIERSRFESDDSVKVKSQDVPSVYVPFGTRPKHIVPISDDNISEDDAEYDTPKKAPQPQPRDVEIAYEPRPWRRSLSQTSYSSKNSRGSWTSRTSSRGSQGRSNQEKQQRSWRTHSVEDFDDGSIASYRSYDSRSSLMSHGSSDLFMERSTSLRKASKKNPFEGGLVDGRPSLEKIFAIVDQVHKEKQTRLATLKEGRRTVEKLPGGPNEVDQDDCSSGKGNINDGSTKSSFRRGAGGGHSVRIGGTTTFGDDGTATNSRNDIARSNYFIHKKKKDSKTTDNSYLKLRHSLQKESSLKKAKIDVAAIASLQVEKFYTERQKAEKQHKKKLIRSDMLLSGGRSESVARLKQSSLKSSLSLSEEDMKEFIAQSIIQSDPLPDAKTSEMGGTELETNASVDDEVKEEKKGIFRLFSKKYLGHSSRRGDNDHSNESKDACTRFTHGNLNLEGIQNCTRGASNGRRSTLGKIFSSAIHRANVLLSSLSLVPLSSECYSHPRHKVRHDFNRALLTARREFLFHQSRQRQLYTD